LLRRPRTLTSRTPTSDAPTRHTPTGDAPTRHRRATTAIAIAAVAVLVPAVAVAATGFPDVPIGSTHGPGVAYVADAGITAGCGDGTRFCPGDAVTRGQMGTFLFRSSGNAPGIAPSVNAARLDGQTRTQIVDAARSASTSRFHTARTTLAAQASADAGPAGSFAKLRDLGTVNLTRGGAVRVTYNTHGLATAGTCNFQLRIGGLNSAGTAGLTGSAAFAGDEAVFLGNGDTPLLMESRFADRVAGPTTIELWVRRVGGTTVCTDNPGNYPRLLTVEELPTAP
jgi:hypothetical protein